MVTSTAALEIRSLCKTYQNGVKALHDIDLKVEEGEFFGLLGPNGAGKSTVIGILSSLVNKTSGTAKVFGVDIDKNFAQAKSFIGVVPQEFNFNIFETPWQILINQAGYYGIPRHVATKRASSYLTQMGLWEKRNNRSAELSGGMKRRLMIARGLVHHPRLLILDEPTAGVDIEIRRSMWNFLQKKNQDGTTIILTTHYLEEAESLCRNVAIIDEGHLIENTSMRSLLRKIDTEIFILDLEQPIKEFPKNTGLAIRLLDEYTVEVAVDRTQNLNFLYEQLSDKNIHVRSMRNKANRLEQLFINLVSQSKESGVTIE
ncbi:MAG: ABC transporter [Acidiferrobacteraceae bacterium]|nr:ABC transporter [Acidiferrobacteraceae bacterium]|tara:strand:- start:885 stop:1832 length:948 start_codon:yes stop_codon:yes gene_type:complete